MYVHRYIYNTDTSAIGPKTDQDGRPTAENERGDISSFISIIKSISICIYIVSICMYVDID